MPTVLLPLPVRIKGGVVRARRQMGQRLALAGGGGDQPDFIIVRLAEKQPVTVRRPIQKVAPRQGVLHAGSQVLQDGKEGGFAVVLDEQVLPIGRSHQLISFTHGAGWLATQRLPGTGIQLLVLVYGVGGQDNGRAVQTGIHVTSLPRISQKDQCHDRLRRRRSRFGQILVLWRLGKMGKDEGEGHKSYSAIE